VFCFPTLLPWLLSLHVNNIQILIIWEVLLGNVTFQTYKWKTAYPCLPLSDPSWDSMNASPGADPVPASCYWMCRTVIRSDFLLFNFFSLGCFVIHTLRLLSNISVWYLEGEFTTLSVFLFSPPIICTYLLFWQNSTIILMKTLICLY
jgi:hypothetical protein